MFFYVYIMVFKKPKTHSLTYLDIKVKNKVKETRN